MKPLALVIENDGSTRRLLDVLLTRSGLDVDLVPAGSDALILLENARYDLVLLDLLLPGTSGMQILEWVANERPRMIPKIIVLSSAPERHMQLVRDRWPQAHIIRKPFELGEIVESAQAMTRDREERIPSLTEELCRRSVRAGARAGVIVRRNGSVLDVLYAFGYEPGQVASYFPLAVDAPLPLCAAIRNATPVWLASLTMAEAEYPLLKPVFARNESRALAVVPLLRDGRAIGAVGWSFREPRLFTEHEQQAFLGIAAALAEALPEGLQDGREQSMNAAGA